MFLETIVVILLVAFLAVCWQDWRYHRIRRTRAQDFQHTFHSSDAFHVIVFFKLSRGDKLVETARRFVEQLDTIGKVRLVYAGQAAFTVNSDQMEAQDWDGVLLFQYPGREEYLRSCEDFRANAARGLFADSYFHAMRRNRRINASISRALLFVRLKNILKGKWRVAPAKSSLEFKTQPEMQPWRDRVRRLRALHEVNRSGLVVFNLVKIPAEGGAAAVEVLGEELLSRMAALDYGPLHVGHPVALERLARFDRIYIVYYPSARYYADMLSSQFFSSVTGHGQLSDALRVPTVPVTSLVRTPESPLRQPPGGVTLRSQSHADKR